MLTFDNSSVVDMSYRFENIFLFRNILYFRRNVFVYIIIIWYVTIRTAADEKSAEAAATYRLKRKNSRPYSATILLLLL